VAAALRHPDDDCPYGTCEGDGFVVDEAANSTADCTCRAERIELKRRRRLQQQLHRAVPKRYQDLDFDRPPVDEIARLHPDAAAKTRAYVADLAANLERGRGLWFFGNKGTGKTSLAYLVAAVAARAGHTVLSWNTITLLNEIRDSFDAERRRQSTHDIVDAACSVDLLHLEDVSAARTSDWVLEQLYLIVNRRYEDEKAIVFTSDVPPGAPPVPDVLGDQIGARTFSRLLEMCGDPLMMLGSDMRMALA
jgi:DNA replication protein DnaC